MTHGSLFSGIGGFDYAAKQMGWDNLFHCEWNEFGQRVLKHYFPQAQSYHDITKSDFTIWRGRIDIITGGFPCQPYSQAGKRLGKEDDRHLWPEMLRVIRQVQPRWVVGENVSGLINWNDGMVFDEVQADLEAEGYEVQPYVLPAAAVNAPHRRDRVWFIAYAKSMGRGRRRCKTSSKWKDNIQQSGDKGLMPCRVTADPDSSRGTQQRKSSNGKGQARYTKESGKWRQYPKQLNELHGLLRDTTDPDSNRLKPQNVTSTGRGERESDNQKIRKRFRDESIRHGSERITTDTDRSIEQGERQRRQGEEKSKGCDSRNTPTRTFENFPTQPPICGGDDGLPTELDGITFPKWRNESIKAYGNAIVPQVALQIFRAIEQYET